LRIFFDQGPLMKILVHDYAGHPFQVDLCRELSRRGHEVHHAHFGGDIGPKGNFSNSEEDVNPIHFKKLIINHPYSKSAFVSRHFGDVNYGKVARDYILSIKPDVVISGNTPTAAQNYILKASKDIGSAFLFWLQDIFSEAALRILSKKFGPFGSLIGYYYKYLETKQFNKSDAIITITEDFAKVISSWGVTKDKIITIENWGSLSGVKKTIKDNAWAREQSINNKFVFMYTGTLGMKHNPFLLSKLAFHFKDYPEVRVVVVSNGSSMDLLRQESEDRQLKNISLLPLQPFERLSEVLASADVVISIIESDAGIFSVPSKVQNYLCAQRSILLAAPAENLAAIVVQREKAGIVVAPDDPDAFLKAARDLHSNHKLREDMALNGNLYAVNAYNISKVTDKFESAFDYALKHNTN
jgi:colanic acid biosynthesis glycosyl transferase WcaI